MSNFRTSSFVNFLRYLKAWPSKNKKNKKQSIKINFLQT